MKMVRYYIVKDDERPVVRSVPVEKFVREPHPEAAAEATPRAAAKPGRDGVGRRIAQRIRRRTEAGA